MSLLARLRAHVVDLTPLRVSRDFRLLFLGKSVSDFGDEIVAVAVPFQVYVITHSTLAVGLLGLCQLVPVFVFPIVGGAVGAATGAAVTGGRVGGAIVGGVIGAAAATALTFDARPNGYYWYDSRCWYRYPNGEYRMVRRGYCG